CITTDKGTWMARKNGRHFVTGNSYPTELVECCLRAGTSARGYCRACGLPFVRVVERLKNEYAAAMSARRRADEIAKTGRADGMTDGPDGYTDTVRTLDWRPSCSCSPVTNPRPGKVLDCFSGSGRTGIACQRLGLDYVGVELNPDYVEM